MSQRCTELRLGTRGSLLAIAQARLVAAALQRLRPERAVRLVTIDTHGDRDLATPLAAARTDFFSATLDAALLSGEIDATVHSRKDLPAARPAGIHCAAIPARANPRDVLLCRADITARIAAGERLRIGSSSPRRQQQAADFLPRHLPRLGPVPPLDFRPLRGPVDQRLRRLALPTTDANALDAVILALAGLERLWQDRDGRAGIASLLAGLRWMVLPLSACPTAAGQGALAIECRREDPATTAWLAELHDPTTARQLALEFAAVAAQPPAERPAFAATALTTPALGDLLFCRGARDRGPSRLEWQRPPRPRQARPWCQRQDLSFTRLACAPPPPGAVFVAHWRAVAPGLLDSRRHRIWVSGTTSWQQLAARGLWVEGCGDHLGFAALLPTLASPVLQLPAPEHWTVLTRAGAEASWAGSGVQRVIASYRLRAAQDADPGELGGATHFYWASAEQFLRCRDRLPPQAVHACGAGKTAVALRRLGIEPLVFPNRREWQAWLD